MAWASVRASTLPFDADASHINEQSAEHLELELERLYADACRKHGVATAASAAPPVASSSIAAPVATSLSARAAPAAIPVLEDEGFAHQLTGGATEAIERACSAYRDVTESPLFTNSGV